MANAQGEIKIEDVNKKVELLEANLKRIQDKEKWYALAAILLGLALYLPPLCYMIKMDQNINWPAALTLSILFIVWFILILGLAHIFTRRKDDF